MSDVVTTYRGHKIYARFGGLGIEYPSGATSPEKYGSVADAQKSIDFDLRRK